MKFFTPFKLFFNRINSLSYLTGLLLILFLTIGEFSFAQAQVNGNCAHIEGQTSNSDPTCTPNDPNAPPRNVIKDDQGFGDGETKILYIKVCGLNSPPCCGEINAYNKSGNSCYGGVIDGPKGPDLSFAQMGEVTSNEQGEECSVTPNNNCSNAQDVLNTGCAQFTFLGWEPDDIDPNCSWWYYEVVSNFGGCQNAISHVTFEITDDTDCCEPPTITCPPDVAIECDESEDPSNTGTPTTTDGCGTVNITFSDSETPGTCSDNYTITRTWTATDEEGNTATCDQTITVDDTTPPNISCPADATVECGNDTSPASTGTATGTDACGTVTISFSDGFSGACGNTGTITRTWTAIDECSNTATCTQTIAILDNTAPNITCPPDVTLECPADTSPANTGTATGSDGCGGVTITSSDASTPGCGNTETITRTWTATDDCGNTATCTQTIAVVDNTPPSIVCPLNVTIECDESSDPSNTGSAIASDNCDNAPVVTFFDLSSSSTCPEEGTITRLWTATDNCGKSASCTQIINIVDITPPVLSGCPDDTTVECDAVPPPANVTATDNCDQSVGVSYNQTNTPGACVGEYILVRTWTTTDNCGNSASCSQAIHVVDTTPPSITCPNDKDRNFTSACQYVVEDFTGEATVGDNCNNSPYTITQSPVPGTVINGECGPSTITITLSVSDCSNNSSSCSFDVTVTDNTPPVVSCGSDRSRNVDANCEYELQDFINEVQVEDNCDNGPYNVSISSSDDESGLDNCGYGTIVRTWTATDCNGNSATCTQNITIDDTTAPTISCPADVTFECSLGDAGMATASDNCDGTLTPTSSDDNSGLDNCGYGTIVRTWTATDCKGNSATCTQNIAIDDTTAPTISCPADVTFECSLGDAGMATANDNCDGPLTPTSSDDVSGLDNCGYGTIVRTWTATDCKGNSATCTQNITIDDTTPPVISCPADETIDCDDPIVWGTPTVSDNCDGSSITPTYSDVESLDECGNGTITRTWTATDCNGNSASCSKTITIEGCLGYETAWARERDENGGPNDPTISTCFDDTDCTNANNLPWGWTTQIEEGNTYYFDALAAAPGYCGNGGLGYDVGDITVDFTQNPPEITIQMDDAGGYSMSEVHVWLGCQELPTKGRKCKTAPGQFSCNYEYDDETYDQFVCDGDCDDPTWIAIHVVAGSVEFCEEDEEEGLIANPNISDSPHTTPTVNKLDVRPNPATDWINLLFDADLEEKAVIQIYDLNGKLVKSEMYQTVKGQNRQHLDINELNNGLYFISVHTENKVMNSRFIVSSK